MRYSYEFKLLCVDLYKSGIYPDTPNGTTDITKKWTGRRQDWGEIRSQLEIYFEERLDGQYF